MVDRGGLNYPIRVRDEFSKTTALFRKELRASKKEFRDFQKVVKGNKSAAKDIREQAKATKQLAAAQRELAKATRSRSKPLTEQEQQLKRLAEIEKQKRAREREGARIARTQRADAERRRRALEREAKAEERNAKAKERAAKAALKARQAKDADFQASKRIAKADFERAIALKQIEKLRSRAKAQFRSGDFAGSARSLSNARALEKSLKGQLGTAQKLLFTFRRLVGALAIFQLARQGVQVFRDLVAQGVQFNDRVANAQLGIAGLVITLGDVRDAQGEIVGNAERLNLALGIARQQTALLRQDSLKTVATFEQLLDTFQVSVGPGLAAGLNLDEVRQLTVDISQAASALGVPQNQLAEEVRSLLSGTIQARTTRIATALGISNEDGIRTIKGWLVRVSVEQQYARKVSHGRFSGPITHDYQS
ncbi:MAG: hypothetical protein GKR86_13475, partial [Ilumatobacter sp.]|nr:hypothetical protein [Ilumatobacter sp.]